MVCFYCNQSSSVINSRPNKRSRQIWRRRRCDSCKRVWSTYETADYATVYVVKSSTGALTPLSRDKLFISIYKSCQHRPTATADASDLATTVMNHLPDIQIDGMIEASALKQIMSRTLQRFDSVAGIHYDAFHA